MEVVSDLIKILLPAGLVLLGMYITVESILKKQFERYVMDLRNKNAEVIIPVRLQAYERMALFLERISPHNLILRINQPNMTVAELQHLMLHEIREEFNHNLSQQIYMTDVTWTLIRNAFEDTVATINISAQVLEPEAPSIELAKRIFESQMNQSSDSVAKALVHLKEEIGLVF